MDPWQYWNDRLRSPRFILAPMVSIALHVDNLFPPRGSQLTHCLDLLISG